ncbi:MAG: single-stranded-DNA-specific exonuclease RecJ [Omnitrophica bacterium]|nr:single-stranded-DNA-specific exonuclease RecJ [Candidatus Omnitrophota bacterium]
MKRRLWKIKELNQRAKILAKRHNIHFVLAQVLLNRQIEEEFFYSFLNPTLDFLHDPKLLPDIEKAKERIMKAVAKKEKIFVFGDYDVDGITSLAIFNEFAKNFPGSFSFYVPHRIEEGYGLSKKVITRAKEEGFGLIIAFDCGTNSVQEIDLARKLDIDIIIVDHHIPKGELTKPFAFINPKREDSAYPFSDLSSGALSFKFLQVLSGNNCLEVLDLVALSIVCDVVPLRGENRCLLKEGLRTIRKSRRVSIRALCEAAGIRQENIDTFHIGYIIGPRINASGRVAHPKYSLDLFLTQQEQKAKELALKLSEYNKLRRGIEAQILKEAETTITTEDALLNNAIIVSGNKWHAGVLGIVASRLANKYNRPSFVISFDGGVGRGSARSIENVHLINMLDECADSLITYGGHSKAAGVEVNKNELENFKEKINMSIKDNLSPQDFIPSFDIDAALCLEDIDTRLVEDLEKLKPYGEGNNQPLFSVCNIFKKTSPKKIRSGFSLWVSNEKRTFEAIIYDKDVLEIIDYADAFDIVFSLGKNNYHDIPKLIIRDCRLASGER